MPQIRIPKLPIDFTKISNDILKETGTDKFSIKRVSTVISGGLLTIAFFANMFYGFHVDEFIFNGIMNIVLLGMGITGLEKFGGYFKGKINMNNNVADDCDKGDKNGNG